MKDDKQDEEEVSNTTSNSNKPSWTVTGIVPDIEIGPVPVPASQIDSLSPQDVDEILAKELNQMSMNERNQIFQEVHGVGDLVEETSTLIQERLHELELELLHCSTSSSTSTSTPSNESHTTTTGLNKAITIEDGQHETTTTATTTEEVNDSWYAYRQAYSINPEYVTDSSFLIQFLRSERFVVKSSAQRIKRYFIEKLNIFGPSKLAVQHILLDDNEAYTTEDRETIESGYLQWLPTHDRCHRSIIFVAIPLRRWKDPMCMRRAMWYLLHAGLENEDTQKYGIVAMAYFMGTIAPDPITGKQSQPRRQPLNRKASYYMGQLVEAVPVRFEGSHSCTESVTTVWAINVLMFFIGEAIRTRNRYHFGSFIEVGYSLMSFGIQPKSLPIDNLGHFDPLPHQQWIRNRRQLEREKQQPPTKEQQEQEEEKEKIYKRMTPQKKKKRDNSSDSSCNEEDDSDEDSHHRYRRRRTSEPASSTTTTTPITAPPATATTTTTSSDTMDIILNPGPKDVLFGKYKIMQSHNKRYRVLIEQYQEEYESSKKSQKTNIAKEIVSQIKSEHGRFLKQVVNTTTTTPETGDVTTTIGWVEVTDLVAREKIGHSFRNLRARGSTTTTPNFSSLFTLQQQQQQQQQQLLLVQQQRMATLMMNEGPSTSLVVTNTNPSGNIGFIGGRDSSTQHLVVSSYPNPSTSFSSSTSILGVPVPNSYNNNNNNNMNGCFGGGGAGDTGGCFGGGGGGIGFAGFCFGGSNIPSHQPLPPQQPVQTMMMNSNNNIIDSQYYQN